MVQERFVRKLVETIIDGRDENGYCSCESGIQNREEVDFIL